MKIHFFYFIVILNCLFCEEGLAQMILLQGSPDSSHNVEEYKVGHPQTIRYSQLLSQDYLQKQDTDIVYDLADLCLKENISEKQCLNKLAEMIEKFEVGEKNQNLVFEILLKMQINSSKNDSKALEPWLCRMAPSDGIKNLSCHNLNIRTEDLKNKMPQSNILLLDGRRVDLNMAEILTTVDTEHVWVLISDFYEPFQFTGTYMQFIQQKPNRRPLVSGRCENFKVNLEDLRVMQNSKIFFSDNCEKLSSIPPRIEASEKSFWQKNQGLTIGLSLLAIGVGAFYFQDKKVVMDIPGISY